MYRISVALSTLKDSTDDDRRRWAVEELRSFFYWSAGANYSVSNDDAGELADICAAQVITAVHSATYFDPANDYQAAAYLKTILRTRFLEEQRRRSRRPLDLMGRADVDAVDDGRRLGPTPSKAELLRKIESDGRLAHGRTAFSAFLKYHMSWISLTTAAGKIRRTKGATRKLFGRIKEWATQKFGDR